MRGGLQKRDNRLQSMPSKLSRKRSSNELFTSRLSSSVLAIVAALEPSTGGIIASSGTAWNSNWLSEEYWPKHDGTIKLGGEIIIGDEKGLDFRKGTLWYGGGETVYLGRAIGQE